MVRTGILFAVLLATVALAGSESDFVRLTSEDLQWEQLEPGLDMAVLEGDPRGEGYYILRARFQPGIFSAPHYHPNTRYVTVIKGTWWTGTGTVWDKENAVPLTPGSYMKHPAGAAHYDGARDEEVIVEIHGIAPAPLVYVDEAGKPLRE
ncbi:MAG TPA: cupin domain-containing protein [Woeseiaceae bacterium]|nr:cupin domain-containing protein [Woeseiaceae bacterium]